LFFLGFYNPFFLRNINGRKKTLKYRVELVSLEEYKPPTTDRVTIIKHKIKEYEKDWELVEIGAPSKDNVPLMFRKKNGL